MTVIKIGWKFIIATVWSRHVTIICIICCLQLLKTLTNRLPADVTVNLRLLIKYVQMTYVFHFCPPVATGSKGSTCFSICWSWKLVLKPKSTIPLGTYNHPKRNCKKASAKFWTNNIEVLGIFVIIIILIWHKKTQNVCCKSGVNPKT